MPVGLLIGSTVAGQSFRGGRGWEQDIQRLAQRDVVNGRGVLQSLIHSLRDGLLTLPVAPQEQTPRLQHQRRAAGPFAHGRVGLQRGQPDGQSDPRQELGGQRWCRALFCRSGARASAVGGQVQRPSDVFQRGGQVQADLAAADLVAEQGRGEVDQGGVTGFTGVYRRDEVGKGDVQFTQPACVRPGAQRLGQGRAHGRAFRCFGDLGVARRKPVHGGVRSSLTGLLH